jgi:AraC-like DNA-binding protein
VGRSRSALARRFTEYVGVPPMRYLAPWRMQLAQYLLRQPGLTVSEVAARVGYDAEAAFSRAFKRHVGAPPVSWRDGYP